MKIHWFFDVQFENTPEVEQISHIHTHKHRQNSSKLAELHN